MQISTFSVPLERYGKGTEKGTREVQKKYKKGTEKVQKRYRKGTVKVQKRYRKGTGTVNIAHSGSDT